MPDIELQSVLNEIMFNQIANGTIGVFLMTVMFVGFAFLAWIWLRK